jgi:hypothetical protein
MEFHKKLVCEQMIIKSIANKYNDYLEKMKNEAFQKTAIMLFEEIRNNEGVMLVPTYKEEMINVYDDIYNEPMLEFKITITIYKLEEVLRFQDWDITKVTDLSGWGKIGKAGYDVTQKRKESETQEVQILRNEIFDELRNEIVSALNGIDKEDCSVDGWWETSTGAEFGTERLNAVLKAIDKAEEEYANKNKTNKTKQDN